MPKKVAALAATTGILTIITAISFARMPDAFVRQIGWFVVVLATLGSVALVATGRWQLAEPDRRVASIVLAVLAFGDVACNLAAFRLNTFGRVPIPTALHAATTICALLLAALAALNAITARREATHRPRIAALGAALVIGGAIIGGVAVFSSLSERAIQPLSSAEQDCGSPSQLFGGPPRNECITQEQAKPLSTDAFFTGLGGLGAAALGAGLIFASQQHREATGVRITVGAMFLLVAITGLTVAARAGANDLDRLHLARGGAERSCATASVPAPAGAVISQEEQAFRNCVVEAHGTNPWHGGFWASLAIALPAMIASGMAVPLALARREENALDSA